MGSPMFYCLCWSTMGIRMMISVTMMKIAANVRPMLGTLKLTLLTGNIFYSTFWIAVDKNKSLKFTSYTSLLHPLGIISINFDWHKQNTQKIVCQKGKMSFLPFCYNNEKFHQCGQLPQNSLDRGLKSIIVRAARTSSSSPVSQ